jgi:membrane-associated phospholipid phosphatase
MQHLKLFFYRLPSNILSIFRGSHLLWHLLAIVSTFIMVTTGFDWFIFEHTRSATLFAYAIPAALLGFVVPVFTPIVLLSVGLIKKNTKILNTAYALTQSAALGWLVSSFYKALTGRAHPELYRAGSAIVDISREFHFGLLKEGIFWGWPSSHTAVAFAIALTVITLYPHTKMKIGALIFACYVGLSVSITIHWFSDFVAGAILGILVGRVVGLTFYRRYLSLENQ